MVPRVFKAGCLAAFTLFAASGAFGQSNNRLQEQLWQSVRDSGDELALESFLDAFPDGPYAQDARNQLAVLHGEASNPASPTQPEAAQSSENVDECDLLTAHPEDLRRTYQPGVAFSVLQDNPQPAIDACIALVRGDTTGRIAFQLSRAYVAAGDEENRLYWVQIAADRGWERAQFRLNLIRANDDDLDKATRMQAVSELEKIGAIYPAAFTEAGRALRFELGGTDQHGARILRLFERAAAFGEPEAFFQIAIYARSDYLDATPFEQLNLLTHLIEIDYKAGWAKDRLAQSVLRAFRIYRNGGEPPQGTIATASRVGLGADGELSEDDMHRIVFWALDGIELSENYDRLPLEERIEILREMIFEFATFMTPPKLNAASTDADVDSLTSQSDPRLDRLWNSFCEIASHFDDPNITIRAKVACDSFRAEFDSTVYTRLMRDRLYGLRRPSEFEKIEAFLKNDLGVENDPANCMQINNIRPMKIREFHMNYNFATREWDDLTLVAVDVTNLCPISLWTDLVGKRRGVERSDRFEPIGVISRIHPNETKTFIPSDDEANHGIPPSDYFEITASVCDLSIVANCPDLSMDSFLRYLSRFSSANRLWNDAQKTYEGAHDAAVAVEVPAVPEPTQRPYPSQTDARFGINDGLCAMIVKATRSLDEAYDYIGAFRDTDDWNWKIFETDTGWFAISASLVIADQASDALNTLKDEGKVPEDSYCTGPDGFVRRHL